VDKLDVRTFWILIFFAAAAIGFIGLAIQSRRVQQIRRENERLRRELTALRQDLTLYQSGPVQPPSPPARIDPVLESENLRPETPAHKERAAKVERPASKTVPAELPSTLRLLIVQAAIVIAGASVLALAGYAMSMFFYPAS